MASRFAVGLVVATLVATAPASLGVAGERSVPESLNGLALMIGEWVAPDSVAAKQPALRDLVIHSHRWAIGTHAIEIREHFRRGHPDSAELRGLIYLDPATDRIEFVAVAGSGADQGRFFRGEYRVLADGAVERTYDVYYRTLTDTPGEELGGRRRRYREVYRRARPNRIDATLDWWLDDQWKPFGPGRYSMVRSSARERSAKS